jgi:endonuclease/exonuclease/phosphatase family metal-dependent hydrolase
METENGSGVMGIIRFLCFNIHGGYSRDGLRDLRRVHDLMEQYNVDIGAFQEMETRPSRGGKRSDVDVLADQKRPHHLPGPTMKEGEGWYGNLIVSRYPIIRAKAHTMETTFDFEPRNAIDALIETPWGKIRLLNTHLSLSPFERRKEFPRLIELVKTVEEEEKHPVILMGDLNEWNPRSRLLRFLDDALVPVSLSATFPSMCPFLKLDRVWYDTPSIMVRGQVLKGPGVSILSDHLPVLIEVALGESVA